jgi:hypothetical protein
VATTAGCGTGDRASESLGAAGRSDRAGHHLATRTLCGRHVGAARADSGELVIADLARGRCGAGGEHSAGVRTASKDSRAKLVGAGYGLLLVMALVFVGQQQVTQCLMVAVVVSVCLAERTPLHPLLQWRPLAFIGVISYGVYFASSLVTGIVVPGHGPLQVRSARRSSRPCCSGSPQRLPMPRATNMTPAMASMTARMPTASRHPVLQIQHERLRLRRRRQVADERDLDNRKHDDGEHDGCADVWQSKEPRYPEAPGRSPAQVPAGRAWPT